MLRRHSRTLALVVAGCVVATATAPAAAAPPTPGRWKLVTSVAPIEPGISEAPGLYRGADGRLHLVWVRHDAALSQSLLYTSFSPSGNRLSPGTPIIQGWTDVSDAAFAPTDQGSLQVFFAGTEGTTAGTPSGLFAASQNADGSWGAPSAPFARSGMVVSAVRLGQPVLSYESQSSVAVKAGLAEGEPETLRSGFTDGSPNIATDGSGRVLVAWCAFGAEGGGIYVQDVDPATGKGLGDARAIPGSVTSYQGSRYSTCVLQTVVSRRIPLVFAGGSFYTAGSAGYPTLTSVKLWKVGGRTLTAARKAGRSHIEPQLAADPNGRVWIGWLEQSRSGYRLVVRRSNRSVSVLGAPVRIKAPRTFQLGAFQASATTRRLDVIGQLTRGADNSLQQTIALPGLTLVRERVRRLPNARREITFRVLDAGDPVGGARVTAGGRSATTGADGRAKLVVTGQPRARARKPGYTPARG